MTEIATSATGLSPLDNVADAIRSLRLDPNSTTGASGEDVWKQDESNVSIIRTLALFHPAELAELKEISRIIPYLSEQSNSLRSALARNALATLEEVICRHSGLVDTEFLVELPSGGMEGHGQDGSQVNRGRSLVALLLLRSTNEKKFIAESAKSALEALCQQTQLDAITIRIIFDQLLESAKASKNVKLVAVACGAAAQCVNTHIRSDASEKCRNIFDVRKHLRILIDLESGKSVEARASCQQMMQICYRCFGESTIEEAIESYGLPATVRARAKSIVANQGPSSGATSTVLPRKSNIIRGEPQRPWVNKGSVAEHLEQSEASS